MERRGRCGEEREGGEGWREEMRMERRGRGDGEREVERRGRSG